MALNRLMLASLRKVNKMRVGQFTNQFGEPAHKRPDGSDWNFGQWLEALVGEIGEACEVRLAFEMGKMSHNDYALKMRKELADIQIYLDLLAMRSLDATHSPNGEVDHACMTMEVMRNIGLYCNERKKFNRNDRTLDEVTHAGSVYLMRAISQLSGLNDMHEVINTPVGRVDNDGIDLGQAVCDKFNEVSVRVGSNTRLHPFSGAPMLQDEAGTWLPFPAEA